MCPLDFHQVHNDVEADILISFVSGNHGDYWPFDGRGGHIAHGFYPFFGGDIHFDDDEWWGKTYPGK